FVRLYERGLIYKGKYIINWCPRCRTALADDEVEHEEHEGHLWHIHYPFKDAKLGHVTVATTRPETMLGDVAVAVDPKDSRYAHLVGKTLILPFLGREMPLIADAYVDAHFGTGCLKVTPAHDPNDFQMGQRHGLTPVCVMNEDATMNRNAGGEFIGMDRFECREALVEELRQKKLLAKIEPYRHAVGHCYRCHTVIEPYLSDQWFVKMKPLAEKAMRATQKGHVAFYPERWSRIYLSWLEQVRDWCISRQIWWGHRIPAWYCQRCKHVAVARETPTACAKCKSANLKQDDDVLDTWFSSALWPFSTMGWPQDTPELAYYYPTSTLVTDRGIIYFWVARMVMMGLEMMGDVPYAHVYINSTVLDKDGRKMSKSHPETCLDPLELIETYGADAVRFTLMLLTAEGQDVRLIAERDETGRNVSQKFEMGRNFANKLWNAARFALMNLCSAPVMASADLPAASTAFEDRWILSRLNSVTERCTAALEKYQFNEAADTLYHFVWHEFCDWYLECIKPRLRETAEASDRAMAQAVLTRVLDSILRLLHPFTPYVTEEIWQHLKRTVPAQGALGADLSKPALIASEWPKPDSEFTDRAIEETMDLLQGLIRGVRDIRNKMNVQDKQPVRALVSAADAKQERAIQRHSAFLIHLANLQLLEVGVGLPKPPASATAVVGQAQVFVPLEGLIDLSAERKRLEKKIEDTQRLLTGVQAKLSNANFVQKAPQAIVAKEQARAAELADQLAKLKTSSADLV
ncbi:MAG: valine--tRNA ligase, partial [Planctomycetes bacterium]|nr:valine--tRNA ligase [Planctomycetota bacterium]